MDPTGLSKLFHLFNKGGVGAYYLESTIKTVWIGPMIQ